MVPLFVRVTCPGCWNLSHLSYTQTSFGTKVGQPRLLSKMSFFLLLMSRELCSRKSVSLWKLRGFVNGSRSFLSVFFSPPNKTKQTNQPGQIFHKERYYFSVWFEGKIVYPCLVQMFSAELPGCPCTRAVVSAKAFPGLTVPGSHPGPGYCSAPKEGALLCFPEACSAPEHLWEGVGSHQQLPQQPCSTQMAFPCTHATICGTNVASEESLTCL